MEVAGGCYYFLFENKTVKRFVQCHVFAQSQPGWGHSDKFPFQTQKPLPICVKMFHSHYCLLAPVIHKVSTLSDIYIIHTQTHTHIFFRV